MGSRWPEGGDSPRKTRKGREKEISTRRNTEGHGSSATTTLICHSRIEPTRFVRHGGMAVAYASGSEMQGASRLVRVAGLMSGLTAVTYGRKMRDLRWPAATPTRK